MSRVRQTSVSIPIQAPSGKTTLKAVTVKRKARPQECPRLLTVPIQDAPKGRGKCPSGYAPKPSKSGKATCCKKKQLIPLRKGTLRKFGYSTSDKQAQRRAALKRAVADDGWLSIFRKLNAVATYNKGRPALHKTFISDRDWVKKTFAK